MLRAKVLKIEGQSAVIVVDCSAYIVDVSAIGDAKPGDEVYITVKALESATYYGIDWSIICPNGLVISPSQLQDVMCRHGIVTEDDVRKNASMLATVLASEARRLGAELYQLVKQQLGG